MDAFIAEVLKFGGPGLVCLALGFALKTLYDRNQALTDALMGVSVKYAELAVTVTNSLDNLTDAVKDSSRGKVE